MVAQPLPSKDSLEIEHTDLPKFKWLSVKLDEVVDLDFRLEGSVYGSKGREAKRVLERCKYNVVGMGEKFIDGAVNFARFKRIFVDNSSGIPIFLPSQVTEIYPKPVKFISPKTDVDIESLRVKRGQILLTCSGTVGAVSYVTETLENLVFSHDVIRLTVKSFPGYVYTYLKSKVGRSLVESNNYGAIVKHIEPHHLEDIPVPDPPFILKEQIHGLIADSFLLRDESNALMDEAQELLSAALKLPDIRSIKNKALNYEVSVDFSNFSVPLSELNDRIDSSYHLPLVQAIEKHLYKHSKQVTSVGDKEIVKSVVLPGRFKRIYVDEENGVVFFGGKQLYSLDPENKKYLSAIRHSAQLLDNMRIRTNTILISRSGTIGKVAIAPEHWNEWIPNEHVIRVEPASNSIAGYLYAWLSSEIAHPLITRHTFAAVVDEIDTTQVSQIRVPMLHDALTQQRINDKVLEANAKRTEAYILEQRALKTLNEEVIFLGQN